MPETVFVNDVIGQGFEKWWRYSEEQRFRMTQAKEYAEAAYRAGYKAMQDVAFSNSASPAPELPFKETLTRDQRDALIAANVFLSVMQSIDENLFNRIQGVLDEISDMLYG